VIASAGAATGLVVRLRLIVAAVGVVLVLCIARLSGTDATPLLAPFTFHDPGQPPLLIVRCGVLFLALSVLRDAPLRAVVVVMLFLLSLAVRGALYPFLLACACLVAPRKEADWTAQTVLYGSLAAAAALGLAVWVKRPEVPPDPRDPRGMVAYWQSRRNPYQARWWALAWTQQERTDPGDAYLALASIDWELGRDAQARKVLAKVFDRASTDIVRERAESVRAVWDRERPMPR
jgi:hypothetical protein